MELEAFDEVSQETLLYVVRNVEDDFATLSANHPLAGLTLTFDGRVTELEELTPEGIKEILEHEHHDH